MAPEDNKQLVRAFIAAQDAEDLDKQRRFLDDNVTLHMPASGTKIIGAPNPVRGADHYIKMRRDALSNIYRPGTRAVTIKFLMADSDLVAVFYNMKSKLVSGGDYENDYVFLYRLKNGKIAEIWEYVDTASSFMQFGFEITKR